MRRYERSEEVIDGEVGGIRGVVDVAIHEKVRPPLGRLGNPRRPVSVTSVPFDVVNAC